MVEPQRVRERLPLPAIYMRPLVLRCDEKTRIRA